MRPRGAVGLLLAGLLTGGFIASGATSADARSHEAGTAVKKTISARLAPTYVGIGEPASLVAQVSPAVAGASVTVQRTVDGTLTDVGTATTDAAGRAVVPLDTSLSGTQALRVVSGTRPPASVTLTVTAGTACVPKVALVDPQATPAARCLASKLDHWRSAGLMGVGQQLNVSNQDYIAPLSALGTRRVSVVGFDLEELADGETYQFPSPPLEALVSLAQQGTVLNATWHAPNPGTGGAYNDRSWHDMAALLDPTTPAYAAFWASFDAKLALFQQLQDAGVAVVFRPLHEANGNWFWWGHPDPTTYKRLWVEMQQHAWNYGDEGGIHNILWAYSFNAVTGSNVSDPVSLLPTTHVDLAGIDAYDPEQGKGNAPDHLPMTGYAAVAAKVKRMAVTEAGPHDSTNKSWNPATIATAARAQRSKPIWSMLWYDDYPTNTPQYFRQLSSLRGGRAWLDSCPNAFCYLR